MLKGFFTAKKAATETTEIPAWMIAIIVALVIITVGVVTHLNQAATTATGQVDSGMTSIQTNASALKLP